MSAAHKTCSMAPPDNPGGDWNSIKAGTLIIVSGMNAMTMYRGPCGCAEVCAACYLDNQETWYRMAVDGKDLPPSLKSAFDSNRPGVQCTFVNGIELGVVRGILMGTDNAPDGLAHAGSAAVLSGVKFQ